MDTIAEAHRHWTEHGWGDAADGMAAVTSVMRAQQILQARVDEVLKPFDLTFARYELLMLLHFSSRGSLPIKKASERLQVHPTSITNAVDRLSAAGLVVRRPHPTDGRGTLVELTADGRLLAGKATDQLNATVFSAPGLTARRVRTLVSVLADLRRSAGDLP
ncbi:MAG TPA: MarR family transcriptional regulator [Mycobacteriales bacterium]|jgi:DNA-binding MarR family transcriptional regulator|nr:MarR family transcriptional regulator [Mycobacteriales bacterium]